MAGAFRFLRNVIFILLIFAILFSYAMFQGGFTSWFLFYSFLPIFLYIVGISFYPISNWKVERKMKKHVVATGDRVTVTIQIRRKIPFPIYYAIIEEAFPESLNRMDLRQAKYQYLEQPNKLYNNREVKKIIFPWFKRNFSITYHLNQLPRGNHILSAVRVRTGDIFGLVKKEHFFSLHNELVVYPVERSLRLVEKMNSYEQGSISTYATNLKNTNVATGVREYMPGDKFSWIDWKQTAKKNDVMTKEFEQEKSTDTLVILNSCYHNGINLLAYEAAVELSISLMEVIRKQSSQVGFLSIGEDTVSFPVKHDPSKMEWIRKHLTQVQPSKNYIFSRKLKEETKKLHNSYYVVILTTHLDDELKESLQHVRLREKKMLILFIQAENRISAEEYRIIHSLRNEGVGISILTEKELVTDPIEVNTL
ncbi:DUF58 domain-containing protein [Ornithinibacillus halotolerans]|uniref:DUF58 domain-containing protein n=1 Tax=Ornithinibacillus halotolerans TaxID=1274357 RepID=A0A916S0R0_9BACI|nr:DUF58 domain-containing protein [Ornithinibacillus halotolerans]GGA75792.1 hypothetical protein GCM10008025_19330 [Ornithinibacillus halotolerans]